MGAVAGDGHIPGLLPPGARPEDPHAAAETARSRARAQFREMPMADLCCGSAGIYNVVHNEMAMQILEKKMGNVNVTGADVIATANPGMHAATARRREALRQTASAWRTSSRSWTKPTARLPRQAESGAVCEQPWRLQTGATVPCLRGWATEHASRPDKYCRGDRKANENKRGRFWNVCHGERGRVCAGAGGKQRYVRPHSREGPSGK